MNALGAAEEGDFGKPFAADRFRRLQHAVLFAFKKSQMLPARLRPVLQLSEKFHKVSDLP